MTNPPDRNLPSAGGFGQILSIVDRGLLLMAAMFAMLGWCVMASRIMSDTHPIWDLVTDHPLALFVFVMKLARRPFAIFVEIDGDFRVPFATIRVKFNRCL